MLNYLSDYLAGFTILLMVVSPLLVPTAVTIVAAIRNRWTTSPEYRANRRMASSPKAPRYAV
jgi:hypothetical protein